MLKRARICSCVAAFVRTYAGQTMFTCCTLKSHPPGDESAHHCGSKQQARGTRREKDTFTDSDYHPRRDAHPRTSSHKPGRVLDTLDCTGLKLAQNSLANYALGRFCRTHVDRESAHHHRALHFTGSHDEPERVLFQPHCWRIRSRIVQYAGSGSSESRGDLGAGG